MSIVDKPIKLLYRFLNQKRDRHEHVVFNVGLVMGFLSREEKSKTLTEIMDGTHLTEGEVRDAIKMMRNPKQIGISPAYKEHMRWLLLRVSKNAR